MYDTHCHLASHRYREDEIAGLVRRAGEAGVERLVTLATNPSDQAANLALAEAYSQVYACLGIHPCDVPVEREAGKEALEVVERLLGHEKVAAVGETGLDYFHAPPEGVSEEVFRGCQRDLLDVHFSLARQYKLNVVLHTRDRRGQQSLLDALDIYRAYQGEVRAVFHCFLGSVDLVQEVVDLGGLVSFTGVITFKSAEQARETAVGCPLDALMLETDAPYLAPVPHRGQRNEPAFVRDTAKFLADLRGMDLGELGEVTSKTAQGFFRFGGC